MILGRCTPTGTHRFAKRATELGIGGWHFKAARDLLLSSIGIGTYLGDPDRKTDALLIGAVKRCLISGACNVIDTAINYRFMKSERCVGSALKELIEEGVLSRDEVLICTKAGHLTHDADDRLSYEEYVTSHLIAKGIVKSDELIAGIHCIAPRYLVWSVEKSLENVGVEAVDVLYLHNAPEMQIPVVGKEAFWDRMKAAINALEELRDEGKISYYGLATWSSLRVKPGSEIHVNLQDLVGFAREVCGRNNGLRFIQLPFNPVMREALTLKNQEVDGKMLSVFEACERLELTVVTSAPLMEGMLLRRWNLPTLQGLTKAQTLIQIARSSPAACALIGQKDPSHVEENLYVARIQPLSGEELENYLGSFSG